LIGPTHLSSLPRGRSTLVEVAIKSLRDVIC
jgi:hypothetical protein